MVTAAADIPLLSIKAQNAALAEELKAAACRVLDSGAFILGPENKGFDAEFAAATGAKHALGVDSGTSALELALEAAGVGPGDEVIVPAFTFVATATAASVLGARPVFADVDPETLTLDPRSAERLITAKTKAIVPVHLFGHPADMDALGALAQARGITIVEDCAQSHLARYKGRPVGGFGAAAAYSFYPTKNLGAAGDAGALTTDSAEMRDRLLVLRNCGRSLGAAYQYERVGHNCRLDEIQAAILRVKLKHLPRWNDARRRVAALYREGLKGVPGLTLPPAGEGGTQPVFHLFTVRSSRRDALAEHLKSRGVGCGVYYPSPLHLSAAYASLGGRAGDCPESERACREVLSLPMFAELPDDAVARVIDAVRAFR